MRKLYPFFWCAFLLALCNTAFAQCPVTIISVDSVCPGSSIILVARTTGGTPTTYTWSSVPPGVYPNNDTITVSPSANTTYTVQVSGNGCNSTIAKTITLRTAPAAPNMNFSPDNVCSGTAISFNTTQVGSLTYTWNFGDGGTASGTNVSRRYTSYGGGTTTYTATVTARGANGCTTGFSRTVTVVERPRATLREGNGVDTTTFNGVITFYKCYTNGQTSTVFNFINNSVPTTGITSTIIWGDTGTNFTSTGSWTNVSHTYGIGIYNLTYIVRNTANGCTDTGRYRVFFGSNAAGGIATLGSTNICGPSSLSFILTNYQTNPPGTLYRITFNDSTSPLTFVHPPPDTIVHYFQESSCGTYSSNGIITYNNSFAAYLSVSNPCGVTSGSVLPIYVSLSPVARFTVTGNDTVCQGTNAVITNTSISGEIANSNNCNRSTIILWDITPTTGWTRTSGSFGSDNGYVGASYDPNSWTSGSNNLNVTFNTLGNYRVRLIAANNCGQPDTTYRTVCVGTPPSPSFTLPSTTGCAPYTLTPVNTTPTPNGCSIVNYTWTATLNNFLCSSDSLNNYGFSGGTNANSTNPNIRFYNQGEYSLVLRAQNACGSFTTPPQLITIKDKPDVTVAPITGICSGQTISPTGSGQSCAGTISGYQWTFQGGTPPSSTSQVPGNVTLNTPGPHNVSLGITNECGTNTRTVIVNVDTIPMAEAGRDTQACNNAVVQIGVPGDTSLSYLWNPATGLSDPMVSNPLVTLTNPGSSPIVVKYYLTVSAGGGGCSATDSVTVTIAPGVTVNAGPPANVCAGQSIALAGSYGGATTSVRWGSNNGGTFSDSTLATSTYTPAIANGTVTLTLSSNIPGGGCPPATSTTTINIIPPPVANPGADDSMCGGDTIQIGAAPQFGYSYRWIPATGLNNVNAANPLLSLTNNTGSITSQTYTLVASATGCSDTAAVTISVYPPAGADAGPPLTMCAGSTIAMNATLSGGATSITWSSPDGTFNPDNTLATQFSPSIPLGVAVVTLTTDDPAGPCPAAVVVVNDTVNPLATITSPLAETVCSGSPTQNITLVSSIPNATYSWAASSPDGVTGFIAGDTTSFIPSQILNNPNDTDGTLIITITPTANNCPGIPADYIIRVNPLPQVILPGTQTICNGDSFLTVSAQSNVAGTTYQWTSLAPQFVSGHTAAGNGDIPGQILRNSGTDTNSVVYTILPTANNCPGISAGYTVIIQPTPLVMFAPAPQTICSGATTQQVALTSPTPGVDINWTAVVPTGLTTADTVGTFTIPPQTLYDTLEGPLTIQYTAVASTTGLSCPGTPANYSITVQPIPELAFNYTPANGCTPLFVNVVPLIRKFGVPDSLTFNWGDGTPNTVLYPNMAPPIWNSLPHAYYNNTSQPVTYNLTMQARNLCIDTTLSQPVSLLPNLITAYFTADTTSGCEPLTVNFRDYSTGANSISWCFEYDRANGACPNGGLVDTPGSSATHTFAAGQHTVALYITNGFGCSRDTAFQTINVSPAPDAAFTTGQACAGAPVTFVQQSSAPSGSFLTAYKWHFGDGDSSIVSAPTHTYNTAAIYDVCLRVGSSFGCIDTACRSITILDKPVVAFTHRDTCLNTQPIVFTNLSTGASFYTWKFGDGNTSAFPNPIHTYAASGNYNVTLVAANNSCTDSVTETVFVYPVPGIGFNTSWNYNCGIPATLQLTNTSTGGVGFQWDFGNGTTSANNNPVATYTATGAYTISLTASNQYQCVSSSGAVVNVYPLPLIQAVDVQPAEGCQPLQVNFTVTGTNINSYTWQFGDGATLNTDEPTASHTYTDTGAYSVFLKVYSFNDCGDTLFMQDTIHVYINPTADFYFTMPADDAPVNGEIQFTNQSINSNTYYWDFGDGTTSTETNPMHLFEQIQQFEVWLIATSGNGCVDSISKSIDVIRKTLFVPNAFAPDFDGGNNLVKVWKPVAAGLRNYRAQIFNKWGELMWESTALDANLSPAEGWNGTYQGIVCPQDAYVWKIEATFLDGSRWTGMNYEKGKPKKTIGSVTLIR